MNISYQRLLDSELWNTHCGDDRLVWVTLLLLRDARGEVRMSVDALAHRAHVGVVACRGALTRFLALHHVREIPGGWRVNGSSDFDADDRRRFWRQQKAAYRARQR